MLIWLLTGSVVLTAAVSIALFASGVYLLHLPAAITLFHGDDLFRTLSVFPSTSACTSVHWRIFYAAGHQMMRTFCLYYRWPWRISESFFFLWFDVHCLLASPLHYRCHCYDVNIIIEHGLRQSHYASERGYYVPSPAEETAFEVLKPYFIVNRFINETRICLPVYCQLLRIHCGLWGSRSRQDGFPEACTACNSNRQWRFSHCHCCRRVRQALLLRMVLVISGIIRKAMKSRLSIREKRINTIF